MSGGDSKYALEVLRAERDQLRSKLNDVLDAIASLENKENVGHDPKPVSGSDARNVNACLDGLTQPEMAAVTLDAFGKPMTAREVLEFWASHNRAPAGPKREQLVQTALRNRAKTVGDVVHLGDGKWGLENWFPPVTLQEIQAKTKTFDAGRARDKKEHIAKTVEGIRQSQAKGVYHGAPPRLTPEQWQLAADLASKGVKLREVWRQLIERAPEGPKSVSYQTIHYYSERLKSGEPYPDRWRLYFEKHRKGNDISALKLRVVK